MEHLMVEDPFKRENILFFDIETHSASQRWNMDRYDFFRLGQFAWNNGEVQLTTELDCLIEQIEAADLIVAHNGIGFDLSVIYGPDSTRALELALEDRVLDTMVLANLVHPSRYMFTMRPPTDDQGNRIVVDPFTGSLKPGRRVFDGLKPEFAKIWLSLDNQAYQLNVGGKEGDLKKLAAKYAKAAGLKASDPQGFGLIPLDDPDFLAYAIQDIVTLRDVAYALRSKANSNRTTWEYIMREMKIVSIDAQNTRNGFRVDVPVAEARVSYLAQEREEIMTRLVDEFDFPTEGKAPWSSAAGKEAIMRILESFGVTPETRPDWGKTATGNLSLGGEVLLEISEGTDAYPIMEALAALKGQRSLAELALESTQDDGYTHPDITRFQRSGRSSVQNPGLTIWTARGDGAVEKEYFLPDPGCKLVSFDLSNADARIVAAYSGDTEYAKRFEPGFDSHEMTGRLAFTDEVYDTDPKHYRTLSKPLTHGWGYRGGAKTLAAHANIPVENAQRFIDSMSDTYPDVIRWQDKVTYEGRSGFVQNEWGRVMVVDKDRSYTQSPALYGQSGTREILCDGLINIAYDNLEVITWLKAQVHDEVIMSIPEEHLWWAPDYIIEQIEMVFSPRGGQPVEFPLAYGEPADNWYLATHD